MTASADIVETATRVIREFPIQARQRPGLLFDAAAADRVRAYAAAQEGWRVNDVRRESVYADHLNGGDAVHRIEYRSFSPFRPAERFEFLFGLRVNGRPDGGDWVFQTTGDGWTLRPEGVGFAVRPDGQTLRVDVG